MGDTTGRITTTGVAVKFTCHAYFALYDFASEASFSVQLR